MHVETDVVLDPESVTIASSLGHQDISLYGQHQRKKLDYMQVSLVQNMHINIKITLSGKFYFVRQTLIFLREWEG